MPILLYVVITPYDNKKMFVSWLELVHAYLEIALESDNSGHALMGRNDSDFFERRVANGKFTASA